MSETPRPRRPAMLSPAMMDAFAQERLDPAVITQVADDTAAILVHAGRASDDPEVTDRLVRLVDEIGLSTVAELWADRPARSLPGALWRLYALREWVVRDAAGASADFAAGLAHADVAAVVAGVATPPGPAEVRRLAEDVLRGVFDGDLAVALERAAAFCRVVAAGRGAGTGGREGETPAASGRAASRPGAWSDIWSDEARRGASLLTTADDLQAVARRWRVDHPA